MLAYTLFNEQDKGSNLLNMITDLCWENKMHQRKRSIALTWSATKNRLLLPLCSNHLLRCLSSQAFIQESVETLAVRSFLHQHWADLPVSWPCDLCYRARHSACKGIICSIGTKVWRYLLTLLCNNVFIFPRVCLLSFLCCTCSVALITG